MAKRFKRWVAEHRDRVYSFAYYNLGNREEAEDVTQEVLLRLWKHRNNIDERTLLAWLNRVSKNACIDVARRRRAYTARIVVNGESEQVVQARTTDPGPDQMVMTSEFHAQLRTALTEIQEPHRTIVIMREIQDMTYDQISESLDLPLNTVKSYLHRARRMLREKLSHVRNQ